MDKKLKELKDKHSGILASMQAILDAAPNGLSAEQQTAFDGHTAEAESVAKQMDNHEVLLKAQAADAALQNRPTPSIGRRTQPDSVILDPTKNPVGTDGAAAIVIPANVKRWGSSLKNFKGADADLKAFKAGMWFLACRGNVRAQQWCNDHGMPVQFMPEDVHQEGVNSQGGYLVYDELDNQIVDLKAQYGVIRKIARLSPMSSDTKSRPRRTGGLTAYHVGETAAGTESTKGWDRIQLIAKKIMVLTKVTNELNEDAIISMADDLVGEIAYAFAYREDDDGINGTGTSTYGGIIGILRQMIIKALGGTATGAVPAASGLVRYDTGYAWSNIALADITDMMALLPQYARLGASFLCSPYFYNSVIVKLLTAAGANTIATLQAGVSGERCLGYPVVLSEAMPQSAAINTIPLLFGNFAQAIDYGDRRQTTIKFSEDASVGGVSVFETDEIAVRGTERFDINVHDVGSATARGPVVGLIAHTG